VTGGARGPTGDPGPRGRRILSVGELSRAIRGVLEGSFDSVLVRGEVTNLSRSQSGHIYFSLVDDGDGSSRLASAQLSCVLWRSSAARLRFPLRNGQKAIVSGRIGVYEPRGAYQLIADSIAPEGVGELQLLFEELKERLRKEGLFDAGRKRPLPFLPGRIGLITSPAGAAIQDVLRALYRRHPAAWLRIAPVRVQGEGAAREIARAIRRLGVPGAVDVIILARGGGSLEDLWAFNEEVVARAIAASPVPVVSAVGHEADVSIADFVADARAQTPTHAPDLVVPDLEDLGDRLSTLRRRLRLGLSSVHARKAAQWTRLLRARVFRDPSLIPARLLERCDDLARELRIHLYNRGRQWDDALRSLFLRLEALNPLRVLERGYALVLDTRGRVVTDAEPLRAGDLLDVRLAKGRVAASVTESVPGGAGAARRETGGRPGTRKER
jgi:exodeoxyribonuclease VII large subunit